MKSVLKSVFGPRPVSTLVGIVFVALAIKLGIRFFQGPKRSDESTDGGFGGAFFGGVLLVNALAHHTHGHREKTSPRRLATYSVRAFGSDRSRTVAFFAGILLMGIFLSYVFSH